MSNIVIERIELHQVRQKLVKAFQTSYGLVRHKDCILVSVYGGGLVGWGECTASAYPSYSYETLKTAWHVLQDFLIPTILGRNLDSIDSIPDFSSVRGHNMAKAALENALWDLLAKSKGLPLYQLLGGVRDQIEVGISIGIQSTIEALLDRVAQSVESDNYQRIKIKIKPGWELKPIQKIREIYPTVQLMVDGNTAFSLTDTELFQQLDKFNLLMIEQPLGFNDIVGHAKLQANIVTPICLDESIHSASMMRQAIELQSCRIINMKVGRVGGLKNAIKIHDMAMDANLSMWCGGMFETIIGRATNLHLATMPNFTLSNDITTARNLSEPIAEPLLYRNRQDSTIAVPKGAGIGVTVMPNILAKYHIRQAVFSKNGHIAETTSNFSQKLDRNTKHITSLPNPKSLLQGDWTEALYTRFEQQVQRVPNREAVITSHFRLTYNELNTLSNRLAHYLLSHHLQKKVIAVYASSCISLVWVLLGILKAGGTFLILNFRDPTLRLVEYCRQAQPKAMLCLESAGVLPRVLQNITPSIQLTLPNSPKLARANLADYSDINPQLEIEPNQLAYIVFTSGSTGKPKGVLGSHYPPTHFIDWQIRTFGLTDRDRFSNFSGISHDTLLRDIFTPLSLGAALYIPDQEDLAPSHLSQWMQEHRITIAHLTPPIGQIISMKPISLPNLRYLFFGGDKLPLSLVQRIWQLAPQVTCVNFYGTTETPQGMSYFVVPRDEGQTGIAPIGQGIDDVQVLVCDEFNQLVAVGEIGEILIRTPYLTRGYLNNPKLTAERFIINPHTQNTTDRLYKTGDLGRYLPNGQVEFLGRRDDQVNIRGFRFELQEIESILLEHPLIYEATVVLKTDDTRQFMIGYVVGTETLDLSILRAYMIERVPRKMVPNIFMQLDTLPLTPNGKIDRQVLPEPDILSQPSAAPRSLLEQQLVAIWEEAFQQKVGINDDFFDLGGQSLLAAQIIINIGDILGMSLSLDTFFNNPTIETLSEELANYSDKQRALPKLLVVHHSQTIPLSSVQQRLWNWQHLTDTMPAYFIPGCRKLLGSLNIPALKQSFSALVARHDMLRASFPTQDEHLVQYIHTFSDVDFPVIDLSESTDPLEVERLLHNFYSKPFDLVQDPLYRVFLIRIAPQEHILGLLLHHLIVDGWSKQLLLKEWGTLYRNFVKNTTQPLPSLPFQYADYIHWQNQLPSDILKSHFDYWQSHIGLNKPRLNLPEDKLIREQLTFVGDKVSLSISPQLYKSLKKISQQEQVTLFITLLSVFKILLYQYCGQTEIVVGSPNIVRPLPELKYVIGNFLNLLVLSSNLDGNPTFKELLKRVKQTVVGAIRHQIVPFEQLIAKFEPGRELNRSPLFRVGMNMTTWQQEYDFCDLECQPLTTPKSLVATFDLRLFVRVRKMPIDMFKGTTNKDHERLELTLLYNAALFNKKRIEQMLIQYQNLIEQVITYPERHIDEFNF